MNQLDAYFRALIDYRKQTLAQRDCSVQRAAIVKANRETDEIEVTRTLCHIEEDWVEAIEKGLVFVEKAIAEERQFIRSNGEVVPIEKVKRVSKDSVEHLAKHSNLITKKMEGEDFVPDQLYTVERLSDYAVYENRFLYMMLCYTRDFISLRYNKILDLTNTYRGRMQMKKTVSYRKQKTVYEISLVEERRDDAYLKENNEAKDIISRIDLVLKAVLHYLSTPLMQEVSKAAKLKPPVTKTNVLKMNQNFKGALALYDYLVAYQGLGYSTEETKRRLNPFTDGVADEMSEILALASFLTYEHGLGIKDYLKKAYDEEEERRKEYEKQRLAEQIKNLQRRIRESGMSPEEYMLLLEKRNRMLEADSAQLVLAKEEIEQLKAEQERLLGVIAEQEEKIASLEAYVEELKAKHAEEIRLLKEAHAAEIQRLNEEHAQALAEQKAAYESEIKRLTDEYENRITALIDEYEGKFRDLTESYEDKIRELTAKYENTIERLTEEYEGKIAALTEDYETKISSLTETYETQIATLTENYETQVSTLTALREKEKAEYEETCEELKAQNLAERNAHKEALEAAEAENLKKLDALRVKHGEKVASLEEESAEKTRLITEKDEAYAALLTEKQFADGRLNALRAEHGLIPEDEDFTEKDKFYELEHQYAAFKKLFKAEWKKVKKRIRREAFRRVKEEETKDENKDGGTDEE